MTETFAIFDRARMTRVADVLALLLAVSLPWSTSATGVLAVLYVLAALPLLRADSLQLIRGAPAGWLPLGLVGFAVIGLLWGDVPQQERLAGLAAFAKLLAIPLLLVHFQRSGRARWVLNGYLVSCSVLLAASLVPLAVPPLRWMWHNGYGVPVKDYISQSGQFLIGAFAALYLAKDYVRANRRLAAVSALLLAVLFVVDIVYVRSGRTAFAVFPVLAILFGLRLFGWKGVAGALVIAAVAAALGWASSSYLRMRTTSVLDEIVRYRTENAVTSSGERLEFWKKSVRFIADAPLIGHGTGSIPAMFRGAVAGTTGPAAEATTNPHNQTFAVGIQLGAIGIALLWAMWIAHVALFRGDGYVAWFGLVAVASSIVGSLFNSHLFDFTQGWVYVVLVGVAGGAMLRPPEPE
jgi:O-antigen ligase